MTKSTITREQLEEWVAQLDEDGGCDATDRQLEALIRQSLAAMDSEPVAENIRIADALEGLLWPNMAIGNKAVIQEAIEALRAYHAHPVPAGLEYLRSIVADPRLLPRRKEWIGGQQYSYVLLEEVEAMVDEACRAAMLHAGNSPEQSDCCPAQNGIAPAQSPIDHGYRPECECSGCKATTRICAELSANSLVNPDCWCRTCRPVFLNDMRFVVCPDCGNKRCPRANDHRNACTGSNEPGQEGSAYPDTPREVK